MHGKRKDRYVVTLGGKLRRRNKRKGASRWETCPRNNPELECVHGKLTHENALVMSLPRSACFKCFQTVHGVVVATAQLFHVRSQDLNWGENDGQSSVVKANPKLEQNNLRYLEVDGVVVDQEESVGVLHALLGSHRSLKKVRGRCRCKIRCRPVLIF